MIRGSGDNGEITFLDIVSLISFCVGLQNLELNITQEDMDEQTRQLDERVNDKIQKALDEIHEHLNVQDAKINRITDTLEELNI